MVYDEPDFLPIWVRHYSAQVGSRNCYVIDHGTDDGSTAADFLGDVNIVRIPRSAHDDDRRARFLSGFCSSLLEWYDFVLHSDADEIVVADPAKHESLTAYCESCKHDVVTAIGFNILHTSDDLPIDPATKVLEQRKWICFSAAMCKPALTRRPVVWYAGFHRAADVEPTFDGLYLFHLRFLDRDIGLRRLARSRAQAWAHADACTWQRVPDEECLQMFARYDSLGRNPKIKIAQSARAVQHALSQTLGSSGCRVGEPDTFNLNFEVDELWPIPKRFLPVF